MFHELTYHASWFSSNVGNISPNDDIRSRYLARKSDAFADTSLNDRNTLEKIPAIRFYLKDLCKCGSK